MTGQRSTLAGNVPVGFWSTYFWHILGACWLFDVGATDEHDSRDEMVREKMPLRLAELTKGYPYKGKSGASDTAEDDLLPRPRFSTRQYDALFVRVARVEEVGQVRIVGGVLSYPEMGAYLLRERVVQG